MFLGTHAGFYSHNHAVESISLALVSVLTLTLIERLGSAMAGCALVGAPTGLLVIMRVSLAVYALPAVAAQSLRIIADGGRLSRLRRAVAFTFLSGPTVIALAQVALVNRWMTGTFTQFAHLFGDDTFTSVDWQHPEFLAVLVHPWHGLLAYHPLYVRGFVALLVLLVERRSTEASWLCVDALGCILTNFYIQAAWYVWWMGTGTFGSRGLAIISIALVPAMPRVISDASGRNRWRARPWLLLTTCCCVWSYLLMCAGNDTVLRLRRSDRGAVAHRGAPAHVADARRVRACVGSRSRSSGVDARARQ